VRGKKHSFPTTGLTPPAHYPVYTGQAQDHNPKERRVHGMLKAACHKESWSLSYPNGWRG